MGASGIARWIGMVALAALGCASQPTRALRARSALTEIASNEHDCFRRHLEEAIALNEERRPRYAARSASASVPLSDKLIGSERAALLVAMYFDYRARPYQDAGIPLFCQEFVSMALVPQMIEAPVPAATAGHAHVAVNSSEMSARFLRTLDDGGLEAVHRSVDGALAELSREPDRHCMVRHLLESARRTAALAIRHEQTAAQVGLESPRPLLEQFVRLQLMVLPDASALDARAAKLQAAGIPIVCGDLPSIPDA